MDIKMDPNRLLSDELTYELMIRGVPTAGTVTEKRVKLRNCLRSEQDDDSTSNLDFPLVPAAELDICKRKLQELKTMIENFDVSNYQNEYARIGSRLTHVHRRLGRITDTSVQLDRAGLNRDCERYLLDVRFKFTTEASAHLLAEHENVTEEDNATNVEATPPSTEPPLEDSATPAESIEVRLTRALEHLSCNLACVPARTSPPKSHFPIHKWNVTYDGGPGLSSFLERIDELSTARGVTRHQLFASAVEFFSGNALTWFRANKNTMNSWGDLTTALKETFLPADYDFSLWDEIRSRTQGPDEKVSIYIANMEGLFSRLSNRPAEMERLIYIRRNLQPYLQQRLGLQTVYTISELNRTCRQLEDIQQRTQQFRGPPSASQSIEPDLAYHRPRTSARIAALDPEPDSVEAIGQSQRSPLRCWNCDQAGHRSANCTAAKRKHCYRCGKPHVTTRNCPKCSGNAKEEH